MLDLDGFWTLRHNEQGTKDKRTRRVLSPAMATSKPRPRTKVNSSTRGTVMCPVFVYRPGPSVCHLVHRPPSHLHRRATVEGRDDAPGIVKVNRFDLDIREEGVLVEYHRASSVVSHVEPVREELVVNILNRLLQGDNMPLPCNLFLDSALFSTSRSSIPVVDAQPLLNR